MKLIHWCPESFTPHLAGLQAHWPANPDEGDEALTLPVVGWLTEVEIEGDEEGNFTPTGGRRVTAAVEVDGEVVSAADAFAGMRDDLEIRYPAAIADGTDVGAVPARQQRQGVVGRVPFERGA